MDTVMDHIGADGVVTEGFGGAMKEAMAVEHAAKSGVTIEDARLKYADSKYFDDITSIVGMGKRGMDTRVTNTELSEQVKTSIHRPGAEAGDDDKAAFLKTLLIEAGGTGNIADYKVTRAAEIPEGLAFNQEAADAMAEVCCAAYMPVDIYRTLVDTGQANAVAGFNARQTVEKESFDAAVKAVTDSHQPDKIVEMGRLAFRYVDKFGLPSGSPGDAVKGGPTGEKDVNGAIALGTDGKPKRLQSMNEIPDNFAEWNRRGVSPAILVHMATVAAKMQPGTTIAGDVRVGSETPEAKQHREYIEGVNANSPDLLPAKA